MYLANMSYEDNYNRIFANTHVNGKAFSRIVFLEKPEYSLFDVPLHLPVGIPAGPLLNSNFVKVALDAGFCLPIYKTVRSFEKQSNPYPNVMHVDASGNAIYNNHFILQPFTEQHYHQNTLSITNSFGVPSKASQVWKNDLLQCQGYTSLGNTVGLSFQGTWTDTFKNYVEDTSKAALLAAHAVTQAGAKIIELNLSCPNENSVPIYKDIDKAVLVINAVAKELRTQYEDCKLLIKVGVLSTQDLYKLINKTVGNIAGISGINSVAVTLNNENSKNLGGRQSVGICGSVILDTGIDFVAKVNSVRKVIGINSKQLAILGGGGVMTAADFLRYREAGADVVQVATGAMWNTSLAKDIAKALGVKYREVENG